MLQPGLPRSAHVAATLSASLLLVGFAGCGSSSDSPSGSAGNAAAGKGGSQSGGGANGAGTSSGGAGAAAGGATGGSAGKAGCSGAAGKTSMGGGAGAAAGGATGGSEMNGSSGASDAGAGGAGSCDPACHATMGSNNCPESQVYWHCGPVHPFSGSPKPCTTIPTPQPTYCCPASYLAECI